MNRMGEVVKKSNLAEQQFEERLLRDQLKKDKDEELKELKKKEMARKRDIDLLKTLDTQMAEKHRLREKEIKENEKYIKMVIDKDQKDRDEDKKKAL
jgi:hypothetical protein